MSYAAVRLALQRLGDEIADAIRAGDRAELARAMRAFAAAQEEF